MKHVCDTLGNRISGHLPPLQIFQELERDLKVWDRILLLLINSLISSMSHRCSTVLAIRGYHTPILKGFSFKDHFYPFFSHMHNLCFFSFSTNMLNKKHFFSCQTWVFLSFKNIFFHTLKHQFDCITTY